MRRYAQTLEGGRHSNLTLALAAGALARIGDPDAARGLFQQALASPPDDDDGRYELYGSDVRDQAAIVALMAESGVMDWDVLDAAAEQLSTLIRGRRYLATQEQAWTVRAAAALGAAAKAGGFAVEADGVRIGAGVVGFYRTATGGSSLPRLRNLGDRPVKGVITVTAAPIQAPPAADEGFAVERIYYDREGARLDPTDIRQNEIVVVVLKGDQRAAGRARALLVDYLPAGFELENARLGGADLGAYGWLGEVLQPEHVELRDDRFVAAFDSRAGQEFRLAYLARAVTPGRFAQGGARIEAMYRPEQFGRSDGAEVVIWAR